MSKASNVIILSPSLFLGMGNKESFTSRGHTCSCCGGSGYFWEDEKDSKDGIKKDCKVCAGGGKLKAVATIEWLPDK